MKTFIRSFIKSLTKPEYYKDVLAAKPSFSVKYYFILSAILTVLSTLPLVIKTTPVLRDNFSTLSQEVSQDYPSDLTVTISPEGVTSNKDFPHIIKTPSIFKDLPKNLVIIDPNGEVGMLQEYNALILINNSYVIVGNNDTVQSTPLKDFPEIQINYQNVQSLSKSLLTIAQNAWIFSTAFFGLGNIIVYLILRPIYLMVFALLLWVVNKHVLQTYSKAMQVCRHTITLPLIIGFLFQAAGLAIPFPAWFILTHTLFTFYVLSRLEKPAQN